MDTFLLTQRATYTPSTPFYGLSLESFSWEISAFHDSEVAPIGSRFAGCYFCPPAWEFLQILVSLTPLKWLALPPPVKGHSEYQWLVFIMKLLLNFDHAVQHHTNPRERHNGLSVMTCVWQRRQIRHKSATERNVTGEKLSVLCFCCFHHFFQ